MSYMNLSPVTKYTQSTRANIYLFMRINFSNNILMGGGRFGGRDEMGEGGVGDSFMYLNLVDGETNTEQPETHKIYTKQKKKTDYKHILYT